MSQVIPIAGRVTQPVPFLVRPHHRLDVGSAHHDAVGVGEFRVQRIVLVETVVPHRRPKGVGLQTQQQFKDVRIKGVVVIAEFVLHPARKVRCFIVQKNAAVFDGGRSLREFPRPDKDRVPVRHRHVRPPVPGRHAHRRRQIINPVNGSAPVTAHDDQAVADTGQGVGHDLGEIRFPFATDA
jgi:hypothetical protein